MVQGCGMSCIRTLLLIFNFVFVLSGIAIIVVGALTFNNLSQVEGIVGKSYIAGPVLLIVVGCIVFLVAFLGCCGAMQESRCMLMTFSVCLFIILVVEIAAGVVGFVYRGKVEGFLKKAMEDSMKQYYNSKDTKKSPEYNAWNYLQKEFECCGTNSSTEWIQQSGKLPFSCCKDMKEGDTCNIKGAYNKGCFNETKRWVKDRTRDVGIAGIVIGLIEIIGIIFACCLANNLKG